ncbi:MAG: hypothetical protein IPM98_16180 [Lewinellaceae bacterium]|nr:hypothetical protein [Lewinellaceae bacterium]
MPYRRYFPLVLLPVFAVFGGCTHYYYAPNTLQTPFLREQHDTRVGLGYIGGDEFNGFEAHAVYSPVPYLALMANHFQVQSDNERSSSAHWGQGRLTEIALGGYYPLSNIVSASLFAGWGGGRVLNSYDQGARADLRFQRRFLQPTIAVQASWIRLGLAMRFNQLQYIRGDIDYQIGEPHISTIARIEQASPVFIPEASITLGFGMRPFWINGHLNINQKSRREELGFAGSTIGVSILCELDFFWQPQPGEQK